jgi:hypothetical protein
MLDSEVIKEISETVGEHYITAVSKDEYNFRFGYWRRINKDELESLLPQYSIIEEEVLEDEDCGVLYDYIIKKK